MNMHTTSHAPAQNERLLLPCFPSEAQRLLIEICLNDDPHSLRESWEHWVVSVEIDHIEAASQRLLPLATERLTKAGIGSGHSEWPRMRGMVRHAWTRNQVHVHRLAPLLARWDAAGLPHLLLKGLPLAFTVYPGPGARPMDDVDVLVPFTEGARAAQMLLDSGWRALSAIPSGAPGDMAWRALHGAGFASPDGLQIDLHWNALEECGAPKADASFWERAVPFATGPLRSRQLCPADTLLHIITHGMRANPISSIRWIVDAMLLLRAGKVDWAILCRECERRRLALPVYHGLEYLRSAHTAPVPEERLHMLKTLAQHPDAWLDRAAHRGNIQGGSLWQAYATWLRYLRAVPEQTAIGRCMEFPTYLRHSWAVTDNRALIGVVMRKLRRR